MTDTINQGFVRYLPVLLEALGASDPEPLRPSAAVAWIRSQTQVPDADLSRLLAEGRQSIFENQVAWAGVYLARAGLLEHAPGGRWRLTPGGRDTRLTAAAAQDLYLRLRSTEPANVPPEDSTPAPALPGAPDKDPEHDERQGACWLVGGRAEQLPRWREEGIWQHGRDAVEPGDGPVAAAVRRMRPGDRIALKCSFTTRRVPFEAGGQRVAVMRILATGTVREASGDSRTVRVAWDPPAAARDWYFYTYRSAAAAIDPDKEAGRRLIDFVFHGVPQDRSWFLAQPGWQEKHASAAGAGEIDLDALAGFPDFTAEELADESPRYTVDDILDEGCFLPRDRLVQILERWREKKNLILQGPPGTGKTWLARRLGFAMAGVGDRDAARSRLRVVQFHPSLSYEDFVRGWRPAGEGRLALVDGILMEAIHAAQADPDNPHVLVIEEINRGHPAQILGEMLTLIEAGKRERAEAMELAYRRHPGETVHVPGNLHLIGTMNVADRSLAIVDVALRRRFAFIDLAPTFGEPWRAWCRARGLEDEVLARIESRLTSLNGEISASVTLGRHFQIGHAFVTPARDAVIVDSRAWFRARVETEIVPLLEEYWYDAPEEAQAAGARLLAGFT